jgi:hypothetical protein
MLGFPSWIQDRKSQVIMPSEPAISVFTKAREHDAIDRLRTASVEPEPANHNSPVPRATYVIL